MIAAGREASVVSTRGGGALPSNLRLIFWNIAPVHDCAADQHNGDHGCSIDPGTQWIPERVSVGLRYIEHSPGELLNGAGRTDESEPRLLIWVPEDVLQHSGEGTREEECNDNEIG